MLLDFIRTAIELGGDGLEIDCKEGQERICAMRGPVGVGIGSLPSNSKECKQLRAEIDALKRSRRVHVGGVVYRATVSEHDSFGEVACRIALGRAKKAN